MVKEDLKNITNLFTQVFRLDQDILLSKYPFRIKIEKWNNPRETENKKDLAEIEEFIMYKIENYPDPRIIY